MSNQTYWLKSIGLPEDPIVKNGFADFREEIHFPKNPQSIHPGDYLLLYAVGHHRLIGLFEVEHRALMFDSEQIAQVNWRSRFPYYLHGNNLFKLFSNDWFNYNVNPFLLQESYITRTKLPITAPGNDSLGGLLHGHSHIRLAEKFAEFLIQEMKRC